MAMTQKEMRGLDCFIAVHLMGYQWCIYGSLGEPVFVSELFPKFTRDHETKYGWRKSGKPEPGSEIKTDLVPRYTTKAASAMQVLKKCAERGSWPEFKRLNKTEPVGNYIWHNPRDNSECSAETLYLAICLFSKQLPSQ